MTLLLTLISLGFYPAPPALAAEIVPIVYTLDNAEDIVRATAVHYGIPADPLIKTLRCESGFVSKQSTIPSRTGPNGREDSWGVAQIHLPAHADITRAQALDPLFAIDWAAREFSVGHQRQWTCFKQLYPRSPNL